MELATPLVFTLPHAIAFWGLLAWAYYKEGQQLKAKKARSAGHDGDDKYSGLVISIGASILQIAAFVMAFIQPWRVAPEYDALMFYAGLGVILAGMLLRVHCWRVLGTFFTHTVTIANDHRVVDNGAYKWLRHPSYLGALMTMAGMGMALGNFGSLLLLVVGSLAIYIYRIEVEETALETALGEAYTQFKKSRKRLIPFVY